MRVLYAVLVVLLASPLFLQADATLVEEIIAKVNGEIITTAELRESRLLLEDSLKQDNLTGARYDAALKQQTDDMLRDRIDRMLILQRAKDLNMVNAKLNGDVDKQVANYQRQTGKLDPDEFERYVVQQTGRPYADFRDRIRDDMLIDGVKSDEIYRKIEIPPADVRAYYDAHKDEFQRKERVFLRQLQVSKAGKTTQEALDAAEKKAKDLSARGKNGEAFGPMAQNNSDAPSKENGGLLPPFLKGDLNDLIVKAVWDQPPGFVTDPIPFRDSWEIFRVEDHQREGLASFSEVEGEIQNKLLQDRAAPAIRAYLTNLRTQAYLQIKDAYTDTGAAPGQDTSWGKPVGIKPETVSLPEVEENPSMKRLLGMFPIPGTQKTGASSSR